MLPTMTSMNRPHTMHFGDVLVVFEGRRRLTWHCQPRRAWKPLELRPTSQEAHSICCALARRQPVLVVVEGREATVPVLAKQVEDPPASIASITAGSGDVRHLRILALDWLPDPLRRRGLAFMEANFAQARKSPAPLQPPFVLEQPALAEDSLRFLHVVQPCDHVERYLPAIVAAAFGHERSERSLRAVA